MFFGKIHGLTPVPADKYTSYLRVYGTCGEIFGNYVGDAVYCSTRVIVTRARIEYADFAFLPRVLFEHPQEHLYLIKQTYNRILSARKYGKRVF